MPHSDTLALQVWLWTPPPVRQADHGAAQGSQTESIGHGAHTWSCSHVLHGVVGREHAGLLG